MRPGVYIWIIKGNHSNGGTLQDRCCEKPRYLHSLIDILYICGFKSGKLPSLISSELIQKLRVSIKHANTRLSNTQHD